MALGWLRAACVLATACVWWVFLLLSKPTGGTYPCWNVSGASLPLFKHTRACCPLFGTRIMDVVMWSLAKKREKETERDKQKERKKKKKFQSGYWSPTGPFRQMFFVCAAAVSLLAQRHRAREVIHDVSLFLVTVSRHKFCSGLRVNMALILLW